MRPHDLIGQSLDDIAVAITTNNGLDTASVYCQLSSGVTCSLPWDLTSPLAVYDQTNPPDPAAISIFGQPKKSKTAWVNPERKTIATLVAEQRQHWLSETIRRWLARWGLRRYPPAYRPYRVTLTDNPIHQLKAQRIVDVIDFPDDEEHPAFLLLANGFVVGAVLVAPTGTGLAGLRCYESLAALLRALPDDESKYYARLNN